MTQFAQANVLFLGDFSLGESYQEKLKRNYLAKEGADYFFFHLKTILKNSTQTVVNFESVITDEKQSPFLKKKNWLHFDRPEKVIKILKDYNFKYLSLANNHSVDFGEKGLKDSFLNLQKNGVNYFGAGVNESESLKPIKLKNLKKDILVFAAFEYRKSYARKFSAYADEKKIGVQNLNSDKFYESISLSKKQNPKVLHIAFIHWGKNYRFKTSKTQEKIAKKLIASGIDLIIGHGAHTIQKIDQIDGKWIIYNIGNSIFPSPGRYAQNKSHPYSLVINLVEDHLTVYPILSDNKLTNYQPRFISKQEFQQVTSIFQTIVKQAKTGHDQFGHFIKLKL